jgi:hypothetical protein
MEENEQWVHQKNLAYNIKVIELAWKVIKHKLGKNIVSGNELNFNNFYGTLERSRETIRNIKHMELNGFNEKHINVWASRIQTKTGISDKYLNGEKRIILSEKFDSKYYKQFDDYMEWWEKIDEHLQIAKDKPLYHHSYEELQKMIEEEDKKEDKKVDKKEVKDLVSKAQDIMEQMKNFDEMLKAEIKRLSQFETITEFNGDVSLFKLFYLIKNSKRYETVDIVTMDDVINIMEKTRTKELKELGKDKLQVYINALEKQLKLARAVYTVAIDCGTFDL